MLYALVHKPVIDDSKIDGFRSKYDPYYKLIGTHLTLIFPTPDVIGKETLSNHIHSVLSRHKSFAIHLSGLGTSWDHWLNLLVSEGNQELIDLHDELYTGVMAPFLRTDLPFIPHVGLGLFVQGNYSVINPEAVELDDSKYREALKEAEALELDYRSMVDRFDLIALNNEGSQVVNSEEFRM